MKIYVGIELNDRQRGSIEALAGEDEIRIHSVFNDDAPMEPAFADCEVVFGNPPSVWLERSQALRWVQLESVGFGEYTELDWTTLGERITLTNLAGFFADPVAESILAGILSLYRGMDRFARLKDEKNWVGDPLRKELRSLRGRRVVLFGRGAINHRLREMLRPFDCEIAAFGRDWEETTFDKALAAADIVVSTVPDTPATRGVFGHQRLNQLKQSCLFVNFGRGSVVDEVALVEALQAGRLGGAVIDVTLDEPLPTRHGLWSCPNTIVTQHTGGGSDDEIDRKIVAFAENLARYRRGDDLAGSVDFSRGY